MSAWLLNDPYQQIFQTDAKTCLESKRIIVYKALVISRVLITFFPAFWSQT